jgi:fructose transport system substrate-binding protein
MADLGVAAAAAFIETGARPSGYTDTGVQLVAARPVSGVESVDVAAGMAGCFGQK